MNFDGIFLLLGTAKELASHPMLLPLVVGELLLKLYSEKVDSADGRLEKGEEVTGMHTFAHRPKGNPLSIGIETTRSLNSSSTTLGVLEMRLNGLLHLFETIAQYSTFLSTIIPQERKETYLRDDFVLREKMDNHLSLCKSLLQRVVYNQRRATTQLAVAYNFAQQKDNMTNLEVAADSRSIAQASKHDSSAMRSIAVLTMVFLPGTAVATIFSMPFFQVQNGQGQSGLVANQFWIYWAVTVPLTFVVLLVWIIWIRWSQYLHAQQDAAARSGKENNPEELNPRALVATFVSLKWLLPIKTKTSSESIETAA
ncbi:hypothetical protein MMC20_002464 [Loxospora ochrophaea]|nr:hypothetical protein [Loxospora ochrophaea]